MPGAARSVDPAKTNLPTLDRGGLALPNKLNSTENHVRQSQARDLF